MNHKLHLPENYKKIGFPGLNGWLYALRSGIYDQGKYRLHCPIGDRYCCLGILSKIQGRLENDADAGTSNFTLDASNPVHSLATHLPDDVYVIIQGCSAMLTTMADLNDEGLTFKEIADILEQTYDHVDA